MTRRPLLRLALPLAAALAGAAWPAHADVAPPVQANPFSSAGSGVMTCVATSYWSTPWMQACVVVLPHPGGGYDVHAVTSEPHAVANETLGATFREDGVADASVLQPGGDAGWPTLKVRIPAGVLPRTGEIDLDLSTDVDYVPGLEADSQHCVANTDVLQFAAVSATGQHDVAVPSGRGTWGGVSVDVVDQCGAPNGAFWRQPVSGTWAFVTPEDEATFAAAGV
jgi:hypothetical protein